MTNVAGTLLPLPRYFGPNTNASRSTETEAETIVPASCTLRDLYVSWNAASAGATTVFTVRLNQADTSLSCWIANGGSSCTNTGSTVSVSAGNKIVLRVSGPVTLPPSISGALIIQASWRCN